MNYLGHRTDLDFYTNDTRFTGTKYSEFQHTLLKTDQGYHIHIWVPKSTPHNIRVRAATESSNKILKNTSKAVLSWSYGYIPDFI
jgi:hypothetical protein